MIYDLCLDIVFSVRGKERKIRDGGRAQREERQTERTREIGAEREERQTERMRERRQTDRENEREIEARREERERESEN